jgi:hypothetical protein
VIVLDANLVSGVMKPAPETRVMEWLRGHALEELATTAVSAAEIGYGSAACPETGAGTTRKRATGRSSRAASAMVSRPSTPPRLICTASWSPAGGRPGRIHPQASRWLA